MRLIDADALTVCLDSAYMGYMFKDFIVKAPTATDLTPSDIADLRNELCLKCGQYRQAHKGACDGCKWKEEWK